jgi:hypothetical protein
MSESTTSCKVPPPAVDPQLTGGARAVRVSSRTEIFHLIALAGLNERGAHEAKKILDQRRGHNEALAFQLC